MGTLIKNGVVYTGIASTNSADLIEYDNTGSGLSAISVQDAIDQVKELADNASASGSAQNITYSNTSSGLSATNVQSAIDEVKELAETSDSSITLTQAEYDALSDEEKNSDTTYYISDANAEGNAGTVEYDNSTSGMSATNVQSAIDELNDNLTKIHYSQSYIGSGNMQSDPIDLSSLGEIVGVIVSQVYNSNNPVALSYEFTTDKTLIVRSASTLSNRLYFGYMVVYK